MIDNAILRRMTGKDLLLVAALSDDAGEEAVECELDRRALANRGHVLSVRSGDLVARPPAARPVRRLARAA